jgi:hypothetical protein
MDATSVLLITPHTTQPPEVILKHLATLVTFLSTSLNKPVQEILIPKLLPALTDDLASQFLARHIPTSISELPEFENLLDAVTQFDNHLVTLKWSQKTSLSSWVSEAAQIWFASRCATFLVETRSFVIHEYTNPKNIIISNGVDIMNESKSTERNEHKTESKGTTDQNTLDLDDEDEGDGWGFDAEDDGEDDVAADTENDAWGFDDENDDPKDQETETESFPYSLSMIPEGIMDIVERVLNEGTLLQSAR